ncbi:hypothetical protein [Streptomyces sp. NPDC056491]|uniref:hypothetical protein n=1 Tax=Streptomyces sp. NPDC056491 TaxID=3345837 RepID=UPI0036D04CDE
MFVKELHEAGITSEHAYTATFASIGLSAVSWLVSVKAERRRQPAAGPASRSAPRCA